VAIGQLECLMSSETCKLQALRADGLMSWMCSGGPCEQSTQEILDMVNRCNEEIDKLRPNAALA
jgi:hypothetical protein